MENESKPLQGKTIVITGLSSGFGRGSALKLASLGANIAGIARRTHLLQSLESEIKSTGGKIITLAGDVSNYKNVQQLHENTISAFGGYDVWINNVGVGALGYFWDIPINDHARLVDVNLKGVIYGAHTALNYFIKTGGGSLINIGSIDSEVPLALQNTYAATKAAVLSLSRSLTQELDLAEMKNINITTIMPWAVDTPWWIHAANYTGHKPRMAAMDDAQIVIDKIAEACLEPKGEITVGAKATASHIFHRIFPRWSEGITADLSKKEAEKADYAPPTTGSIYEPMARGNDVDGNIRERMKKEDEE